eukprot:7384784-Prymnesium_polylepis.4
MQIEFGEQWRASAAKLQLEQACDLPRDPTRDTHVTPMWHPYDTRQAAARAGACHTSVWTPCAPM